MMFALPSLPLVYLLIPLLWVKQHNISVTLVVERTVCKPSTIWHKNTCFFRVTYNLTQLQWFHLFTPISTDVLSLKSLAESLQIGQTA